MLYFFGRKEPSAFQRFMGALLLITGCCIGAGMLGLPVLTAQAGFIPALAGLLFAWGFMASTGLLLAEVTLWFRQDVHLLTMAEKTLGRGAKWLACVTFLYLFYCALVAYMTASGELVADGIEQWLHVPITRSFGVVLFVAFMAPWLYLGTLAVERWNRLLLAGLFIAYLLIICFALPHVEGKALLRANWSYFFYGLPALVFSFGYHNLVPSLAGYLHYERKPLVKAILIGSALPLAVYIIWEALTLGLIPLTGANGFNEALLEGSSATHLLQEASQSPLIIALAQVFAFCAIVTSFLGVALSFIDFLADGFKVKQKGLTGLGLLALALGPPFVFSLVHPDFFLSALNYASAFGAVILFGILPACMVLRGRQETYSAQEEPILRGGNAPLILIIVISLSIALLQFYRDWIAPLLQGTEI